MTRRNMIAGLSTLTAALTTLTSPAETSDAKIMGVASGLADYTGIDPTIVRIGFVALTLITGPVMILFYLLIGLLAPRQ